MFIRATMLQSIQPIEEAFASFSGSEREEMLKNSKAKQQHLIRTGDNTGMVVAIYETEEDAAWEQRYNSVREYWINNGGIGAWPVDGPVVWSMN